VPNKLDVTVYLKYFIYPIICLISITIIYFVLILPYLSLKNELDSTRQLKNNQIQNYENKLAILQSARKDKAELQKYKDILNEIVPTDESPAPLVGYLDMISGKFNFSKIDENKNIADQPLLNQGYIEVRFNGRTAGPLSALNFIKEINNNSNKLINIRNIELFDDRDSKYYRISFISRTIFNKTKPVVSLDSNVYDIMRDHNFLNFIKNFTN